MRFTKRLRDRIVPPQELRDRIVPPPLPLPPPPLPAIELTGRLDALYSAITCLAVELGSLRADTQRLLSIHGRLAGILEEKAQGTEPESEDLAEVQRLAKEYLRRQDGVEPDYTAIDAVREIVLRGDDAIRRAEKTSLRRILQRLYEKCPPVYQEDLPADNAELMADIMDALENLEVAIPERNPA